MKKETIIWQLIMIVIGASLIFILSNHLQDRNIITARTNRAACHMNSYKTTEVVTERGMYNALCSSIENFNE